MRLRSLLAVALGAFALAGCGSNDSALIPQDDADQLSTLVNDAGQASASGECDTARRAVADAERELAGLPRKTSAKLKRNLRDWLDHLDSRIEQECKAPEPDETVTPEPTKTASPTPTATSSPEPTATSSPEPTATVSPEPTATTVPGTGGQGAPEEPPGTGGVPPVDG